MAFTTDNLVQDSEIRVIVRKDDALDVTDEEYQEYLETLDESLLKLKDGKEPTRWVLRTQLPYKHAKRIESDKVRFNAVDGQATINVGFISEEIRATLKDIINPPSVPKEKQLKLKFTGDGLVMESFIESIDPLGIPKNLYDARIAYLNRAGGNEPELLKKKSEPL